MSAAPAAITKRWHVGDHVCTLTIPRTERDQAPAASLSWWPCKPEQLIDDDRAEFERGIASAFAFVERCTGVRPILTGESPCPHS